MFFTFCSLRCMLSAHSILKCETIHITIKCYIHRAPICVCVCVGFHSAEWGTYYPLPEHRIIARNDFLLVRIFNNNGLRTDNHSTQFHSFGLGYDCYYDFHSRYEQLFCHRSKEFSYMCDVCTHTWPNDSLLSLRSTIAYIDQCREAVDQKWRTQNLIIFAWFGVPWRKGNTYTKLKIAKSVLYL